MRVLKAHRLQVRHSLLDQVADLRSHLLHVRLVIAGEYVRTAVRMRVVYQQMSAGDAVTLTGIAHGLKVGDRHLQQVHSNYTHASITVVEHHYLCQQVSDYAD